MSLFFGVLLFLCVLWALLGPLLSLRLEKRLEWFLFGMGVLAATISWAWSEALVLEALMRPMKVCGAVLFGSLVFSFTYETFRRFVRRVTDRIGPRVAIVGSIIFLGIASAFVTSVIGALILVELLHAMRLERKSEIHVAVLGSFAVGMGGGLSPIGGPVSAVTMSKLSALGSDFLFGLLGSWLVPAIVACGAVAGTLFVELAEERDKPLEEDPLSLWNIMVVTVRMYVFILGLVLLGAGIVPLIDRILIDAPPAVLFWINTISGVVDGATLASVEISPRMSYEQLRFILVSLLVAGGALVPGNASNVVTAHKLKIPNREWAKIGLPFGALLMLICFFAMVLPA